MQALSLTGLLLHYRYIMSPAPLLPVWWLCLLKAAIAFISHDCCVAPGAHESCTLHADLAFTIAVRRSLIVSPIQPGATVVLCQWLSCCHHCLMSYVQTLFSKVSNDHHYYKLYRCISSFAVLLNP